MLGIVIELGDSGVSYFWVLVVYEDEFVMLLELDFIFEVECVLI